MNDRLVETTGGTSEDDPDDPLDSGSLAEELGVSEEYASEELAPPVDREKLRRFIRKELSEKEAVELRHAIATFRSWRDALADVLEDEATR